MLTIAFAAVIAAERARCEGGWSSEDDIDE
jgi:hypothetical protein